MNANGMLINLGYALESLVNVRIDHGVFHKIGKVFDHRVGVKGCAILKQNPSAQGKFIGKIVYLGIRCCHHILPPFVISARANQRAIDQF